MKKRTGFTIVELLVVVAIIALLIGILLPAIGKARDGAYVTQSLGNLRNLAAANAHYGADYQDRQFSLSPDDLGLYGGNCQQYVAITCPAQPILGWDSSGGLWGYWFPGPVPPCNQYPGNCGNFVCIFPMSFNAGDGFFGTWQMCNLKAFNPYVNARWYDKIFFAPKDKWSGSRAERGLNNSGEFTILPNIPGQVVFSTYRFSPAAMWSPDVLSSNAQQGANAGRPQNCGPGAWRTPAVGQAKFPDLKTRMLEHYWLQNRDGGEYNPGVSPQTPWFFNHGYNSAPATLFFDGHVAIAGVAEAQESDGRVARQNQTQAAGQPALHPGGRGLWHRGTPLGGNGFYNQLAYDMVVECSYHILTVDGILGRDFIGAK
jgi:prepilin-type N-terminal cleavage/methylation domain-containing protein